MNLKSIIVASALTLSGTVMAAGQYSKLIVTDNNPAAAMSCSVIMLQASGVPGLPSDLIVKASAASKRFLNMFQNGSKELLVRGDNTGYMAALNADSTTLGRINALPQPQRNQELLRAADQCMSVL